MLYIAAYIAGLLTLPAILAGLAYFGDSSNAEPTRKPRYIIR